MANLLKSGRVCGRSWCRWAKRLVLLTGILALFAASFMFSTCFAHSMDLIVVKEGTLQVNYDGGIPARRAVVTVYDAGGTILAEGAVDPEGLFYFDPELPAFSAEAQDGLGHKAVLTFGRESRRLPRFAGGVLGVFFLLSVAGGAKIINQRKGEF
jgi:hypothetical protein